MTTLPWETIIKIVTTLLPIVGSIVVAYITKNHAIDRKAMQYERLNKALNDKNHNKLEVAEYFRMVTGLRMNYSDIKKIIDDENSIWLVYFLQRNSGYVQYDNGKLSHTKRFANEKKRNIFLIFEKWHYKYMIYSTGTVYIVSAIALLFAKNTAMSIVAILFLFGSALMFVSLSKDRNKVEKLEDLLKLANEEK